MRFLKMVSLVSLSTVLMLGVKSASSFSFDFSNDDNNYSNYYYYWYGTNHPLVAPNGAYFYPSLPYFERLRMIERRQERMKYKRDAVDTLGEMLYGSADFDRATAIKLSRGIESIAGTTLVDNFHPGAIASNRSRATVAIWGNQEAFKSYAFALQGAARELAEEFEKQPTKEEGAVSMPKPVERGELPSEETVAVSAGVWNKFNTMVQMCYACHREFRGAGY